MSWCGTREACSPFCFSLQPLLDAEAVLLVDDHERELPERHALLKQRMRADDDARAAVGDCRERGGTRTRRLRADQSRHLDVEGPKPALEAREMLLGEQLRRRHDGRLAARRGRDERRHRRDHRLAASRRRLAAAGSSACSRSRSAAISSNAVCCARSELETAARRETRASRAAGFGNGRARSVRALAAERRKLRRCAISSSSAMRREQGCLPESSRAVAASRGGECRYSRAVAQRRPRRAAQRARRERRREIVLERLALEHHERSFDDAAHRLLGEAFRRRIDRRQAVARAPLRRRPARRDARDAPSRGRRGPSEPRRSSARAGREPAFAAASD